MWVPRCIIAAISMLVLTATPAVVEGTCQCADVCPIFDCDQTRTHPLKHVCWLNEKHCDNNQMAKKNPLCAGYCVCNTWGCNCDGCGSCEIPIPVHPWGRRMFDDKENEDVCADFRYITSLSPEGKRDLLAKKYCLEDDKVAVQNIFEILRNEVLRKFGGSVLTCALFNKSFVDVRHLKLCEDKQHVAVSLLTSSSTGATTGGPSFVLVVVGLLGAAMMAMTVVQRRHRGLFLRRHQYSEVDATTTPI